MKTEKPLQALLLLGFLSFVWGSSFILMKLGMENAEGRPVFSSNQVGAMRIGFAFISLLPFALIYLKHIPKSKLLPVTLVGLIGNTIPAFLFTAAETKVAPSLAGMLNSTTPLFTVLIAYLVFKNRFSLLNYLGLVIGFLGSCGLMLANGSDQFYGEITYSLLIILATLCYAFSVNIIRNYLAGLKPIAITAVSFIFVGPPIVIYLFSTNFLEVLQDNPAGYSSMGYIIILAVVGTALSVLLFNYLIQITNAVYASTVTYLIPVTAIFWGYLRSEPINSYHFMGMATILTGVYLINKKG